MACGYGLIAGKGELVSDGTLRCPLCGINGELKLKQSDLVLGVHPALVHELYRCRSCDVYFQTPMPPELLLSFYPERYYEEGRKSGVHRVLGQFRLMRRARAVTWRAQKGSVLDVGCGRGMLLAELKRLGWNAVGTDWNAANAQRVAEHLGVTVLGGENALEQIPPESFQAASLLHVLEHEDRPVELLRKVHRVLVNGGRLLVGVPNGGSLARAVFGCFWSGYDVPRHRWVFTHASLRCCLENSGFRVERVTGRLSDEWRDVLGSCQLYCRARGWSSRVPAVVLAAVAAGPMTVASFLGFGSVVYVYASKI